MTPKEFAEANTLHTLTPSQRTHIQELVSKMIWAHVAANCSTNEVFLITGHGNRAFEVVQPDTHSPAHASSLNEYLSGFLSKAYAYGMHSQLTKEEALRAEIVQLQQGKRDLQQTVESLSSQLQTFHDRLCDAMLLPRHTSWDVLLDTTSATRDLSGQRLHSIQELQKKLDERLEQAVELTGASRASNWAQLVAHLQSHVMQYLNNYKRLGEEMEGHRAKMCEALQCGSGTGWAPITARVSEILKSNDDLSESVRRTADQREEMCRTLRLGGSFSWEYVLKAAKERMQRLDEQDAQISALIQQQLANNEVLIERTSAGYAQQQKNMARELGLDENARFSTMMREVRELKAQAQQYKALQAAAKLLMKGLLEEEAR